MERCPSCGAPARPGAKFCTTCGHSLAAEDQATFEPETSPLNPTVDTAPIADDTWLPAVDPAEPPPILDDDHRETDGPLLEQSEESAVGSVAVAESESADQVLSSSWPAPAPNPWSAEWRPTSVSSTSEATSVADSVEERTDRPPAASPIDVELPPTLIAPGESFAGEVPEIFTGDEQSPSPPEAMADAGPAPSLAPRLIAFPSPPSPETGQETASLNWASASSLEQSPSSDPPLDQALTLIDQLRTLLPNLRGQSHPDLIEIAQELEETVSADAARSQLEDLRASMLAARDRPRDIDTVLDLARRVDDVLALIDHQIQLEAVVERAAARLRREVT